MKRFLSLFVIFALLLSFALVLTGCQEGAKDTETEPETLGDPVKDPSVMTDVYANTLSAFISRDPSTVLKAALLKGSINFRLATEVEDSPLRIEETIYTDSVGGKFASETLLSLMGEEMSATIWGDRAGSLIIQSEALLGNPNAYAVCLDTLSKELKGSALASMLEIPDEDVDEILKVIEKLKSYLDPAALGSQKPDALKWQEKLNALIDTTAKTEMVKSEDGQSETEYLLVTYVIDNDTIKGLIDLVGELAVDLMGDQATDTDIREMLDALAEAKTELDAAVSINITETVSILVKAQVVETIDVTMKIVPKTPYEAENGTITDYATDELSGHITIVFSPDNITLGLEITTEDNNTGSETIKGTATIDKKVEGDITTYTAKISGGTANVTADILNATLTYNPTTEELTLTGDVMMDETNRATFGAKALYKVTPTEISFDLKSFTNNEHTTYMLPGEKEFSFTVKVGTAFPAAPADAKDIVTLDEEALGALLADIAESPLGQLFGNSGGGVVMPDSPLDSEIIVHHFDDEFHLAISQDFAEIELEGYAGAYETDEAVVLVLRESKADCSAAGIHSLDEYVTTVMTNSGLSADDRMEIEGLPCFEYTSGEFAYFATVCETEEAYWFVNFAAYEASYDAYWSDFASYVEYLSMLNAQ